MLPKINETHRKNCHTLRRGRPCNLKKQLRKINGRYRIHAIQNNTKKHLRPTNLKPQMQQTVKGMDLTHLEYDTCYDKLLLSHVLSCCDIFDIFTQKKFKKQMMKSKTMMIFYNNFVGNFK